MIGRITAICLAFALAACSTANVAGPSPQAFAGAAPAERPVATAVVEAMAGGLVGGALGADLDKRDRRRALEAEYRALEYTQAGQAVPWGAAGGRRNGEVVAGSPYRVGSQDCRQYTHTVNIGGRTQSARGSACRNADGTWTPLA